MQTRQQLNLKNKLSKRDRIMDMESFDGCQMGRGCGAVGEEVRGLRNTNRQLQNSHGDVQYSLGNGLAKELTRMTHGHEQWWGDCLRDWRGAKREKSGQL